MCKNLLFAPYYRILLLALVLGFSIAGCNKGTAPAEQSSATQGASSTADAMPPAVDGLALYAKANCAMCHGDDRAGKPLGPSLLSLKDNWDNVKLVSYLKDPQGYTANDERLSGESSKYSMKMSPAKLSDDEIKQLAAWLLNQ
jgi:mono/diheme cytochrome c family protein